MRFDPYVLEQIINSFRHPQGWELEARTARHSNGLELLIVPNTHDAFVRCRLNVLRRTHRFGVFSPSFFGCDTLDAIEQVLLCSLYLPQHTSEDFQRAWSEQVGIVFWHRLQALSYAVAYAYQIDDDAWEFSAAREDMIFSPKHRRHLPIQQDFWHTFIVPAYWKSLDHEQHLKPLKTFPLRPAPSQHALMKAFATIEAWNPALLEVLRA